MVLQKLGGVQDVRDGVRVRTNVDVVGDPLKHIGKILDFSQNFRGTEAKICSLSQCHMGAMENIAQVLPSEGVATSVRNRVSAPVN